MSTTRKRFAIQPLLLICAHCLHFTRVEGGGYCIKREAATLSTTTACQNWIDSIYGTTPDGVTPSTLAPEKETSHDTDQ